MKAPRFYAFEHPVIGHIGLEYGDPQSEERLSIRFDQHGRFTSAGWRVGPLEAEFRRILDLVRPRLEDLRRLYAPPRRMARYSKDKLEYCACLADALNGLDLAAPE